MIAFALAYCSSPHTEAVTPRWSQLTNVLYLADRTDAPGIVAVTADSKAHVLDANGKPEGVYIVPENSRVLRYEKRDFGDYKYLVTARNTVDIISNVKYPTQLTTGQGTNTIMLLPGCAVFTETSTFSPPLIGHFDGIAVRNDGNSIVLANSPMGIPIFTSYSYNGTTWSESTVQLTPTIEDQGFVRHLDRFSDLRFIDENRLVFIGSVVSFKDQDQLVLPPPLIESDSLEIHKNGNLKISLYIFNQRRRTTTPLIAGVVSSNGESGGPNFGQLAVSNDLSCAYVICWDGIARVDLGVLKDWP